MYKILLLFFIILCSSTSNNKLSVTVYYESLCPDSVRFIRTQLYPTWKELGDYLDITFIPFGKSSSVNGGESFQCQHGPEECTGNKLQSCTLNQLAGNNKLQVEYVNCFMTPYRKAKDCTELVGINWNSIKECFASDVGTQLQLEAEAHTQNVKPTFVPTVVFNGIFDQELQDASQNDFKGVVCSFLQQSYNNVC